MNFLYPSFLFALSAVIIPIIIHLFNFRSYKTVYFSNVQFLKDIKQETRSKSTLKHLLVLISRILAISALVFAFSQPFIPADTSNGGQNNYAVCIYVDNSFSTQAESKYGTVSEVIKKKALETAEIYPENTQFLYLTNDFEQKHLHYVSKEQLKDFILETELSPVVKKISDVINKVQMFFNESYQSGTNYSIYILSDLQKTSTDLKKLQKDSLNSIVFIPVESQTVNNMYIDSVWFEEPERPLFQSDQLHVKITNKSDESYSEIPLNLYLDDTLKAAQSFQIEANESRVEILSFINNKTGIVNGKVEISDFPVSYDNEFLFNFNLKKEINTLVISEKNTNKYIENVFKSVAYVSTHYKSPALISDLKEFDVIILDEVNTLSDQLINKLINFTTEGGKLIVFPGIRTHIESHNKLYNKLGVNLITGIDTSKIYAGKINYDAQVFKNVFKVKEKKPDLPYFLQRVQFSDQTYSNEEVILSSERNDKLISSSTYGTGKVYIFSQAAVKEAGNLVFHPLWVPMLYNMVVFGTTDSKIFYTIGDEQFIRAKSTKEVNDHVYHIVNKDTDFDIIPKVFQTSGNFVNISTENMIKDAGHYALIYQNKIIQGITFNYDRSESDLNYFSPNEINDYINKNKLENYSVLRSDTDLISESIKEQTFGKSLINLFILAALIFLLIEILLIRFLK